MVLNRVYCNLMPLLVVVILITFCGNAYSQEPPPLTPSAAYSSYVDARVSLNDVNDELDKAEIVLLQYEQIRGGILKELEKNGSDSRTNVKNSIKGRITGNIPDVVDAWISQIGATMTGVELINKLDSINTQIGEFTYEDENGENIFQRTDGYNATYDGYIEAYKALNDQYRALANKRAFQIYDTQYRVKPKREPKQTSGIFVSPCATPTGTCYGYYVNPNRHQLKCELKHGVSGETNVDWWTCQSTSKGRCQRASEHWLPCPGNCGEKYPPKKVSKGRGQFYYSDNVDFPHEVKCKEKVYDGFWKYWMKCFGKHGDSSIWYTCQRSSCPNSASHDDGNSNSYYNENGSGSGSGSGSTSENTPTPSTPSTPPTPSTPTPTPTPPVDNTPDCSTCTDGCSSCPLTCANGHKYDPSKANQVNEHRTRTCRICRQTWEVCGSGRPSVCNDPKRKRQGKGCWAERFLTLSA